MDLDAACCALEKWASARHADCGPCARDARTTATGIEKGPLFLLEKGVVMSSAHIGHYLLTRRTTLPIAVSPRMILDERLRPCWRRWASRSILLPRSWVMSQAAKKPALVRHYVHTDMLERKAHALSAGMRG